MKKKILAFALGLTLCLGMTGCSSLERSVTDLRVILMVVCREQLLYTQQMVRNLQHIKERLTLKQMMVDMLSLILTARDISIIIAFVESIATID